MHQSPVQFIGSCAFFVSEKALAGKMRCQSVDTDNSTSPVEHTSRRISPDYAGKTAKVVLESWLHR
jgi:hypothetical protein